MCSVRIAAVFLLASAVVSACAQAREWTDDTGQYAIEAELIAASDTTVVLKRADAELVAFPVDRLSKADRDYLASEEAVDSARKLAEAVQTWTLRDGAQIHGRLVDYARRDVTIQRRRGRIYVNDRVFDNLPEFYRDLVPKIVAHLEQLPRADLRAFRDWAQRQRARPTTYQLEGVILEVENGDEYAVPFFLFSDEDAKLLQSGWDDWLAGQDDGLESHDEHAFLLRSLLAAHHQDRLVQRQIALLQLKLQAVEAGVTSLWEVALIPGPGQHSPPLWVVAPGRDSRQAVQNALSQNPGFVAGPVRRVNRR